MSAGDISPLPTQISASLSYSTPNCPGAIPCRGSWLWIRNNEYEIEHYRHNAIITKDHDFIFASEDPQIIFENQWENNVREIKIAFRIREAGLQDNPILSALSELKCHMDKVENELEYIKGTKVYKTLLERKVDKVLGENE